MTRPLLLSLVVLAGCASSVSDDEPAERARSQYDVANWFMDNGYTVQECGIGTQIDNVRGRQICLSGVATNWITVWTYGSERQARQALAQIKVRNGIGTQALTGRSRASVHQSGPIVVYFVGGQDDLTVQRDLVRILGPAR